MTTEQANSKPISLGFDASSWNYGSFYPIQPYKQKVINKETTVPINRDYSDLYNSNYMSKPKSSQSSTKLRREDKIIKDDYVRNMNLLKLTGTSKNKSNKPVIIVNPVTQKVITCDDSVLSKNLSTNKITQKTFHNKTNSNTSQLNMTNNSTMKYSLKYDEWLTLKKSQSEIQKGISQLKEEEFKKLELLKEKIKKEYEPIKDEKYQEWLKKKKEKLKADKIEKVKKENEKVIVKSKKEIEKEEKLNLWFQKQAFLIEQKLKEDELNAQLEKKKKEKEKENKEMRRIESQNKFKQWSETKNEHLKLIKQLDEKGFELKGNNKLVPKKKKEGYKNKKLKLVIGPYKNAKIYREIQHLVEEQLDQTEEERYTENEEIGDEEEQENNNQLYDMANNQIMNQEQMDLESNLEDQNQNYYEQNENEDQVNNEENENYVNYYDPNYDPNQNYEEYEEQEEQ